MVCCEGDVVNLVAGREDKQAKDGKHIQEEGFVSISSQVGKNLGFLKGTTINVFDGNGGHRMDLVSCLHSIELVGGPKKRVSFKQDLEALLYLANIERTEEFQRDGYVVSTSFRGKLMQEPERTLSVGEGMKRGHRLTSEASAP